MRVEKKNIFGYIFFFVKNCILKNTGFETVSGLVRPKNTSFVHKNSKITDLTGYFDHFQPPIFWLFFGLSWKLRKQHRKLSKSVIFERIIAGSCLDSQNTSENAIKSMISRMQLLPKKKTYRKKKRMENTFFFSTGVSLNFVKKRNVYLETSHLTNKMCTSPLL